MECEGLMSKSSSSNESVRTNRKRTLPSSFQNGIRRSKRGSNSLASLARIIMNCPDTHTNDDLGPENRQSTQNHNSNVVLFITGAGLSAESGIPTFRGGSNAIWSQSLWSHATREAFRLDPLGWYNDFWLCNFPTHYDGYFANDGHEALAELCELKDANVRVVTQNVDGLHRRTKCKWNCDEKLVEAHGRIGLYKCIPDTDTDSEDEREDDENRPVKLGRRENSSQVRVDCVYAKEMSIEANSLIPKHVRKTLLCEGPPNNSNVRLIRDKSGEITEESPEIDTPPRCPGCRKFCLPQALLFDEGYHR